MTDSDDTEQVPKILTFEPLGFLANQSTSDDSTNEPRQLETYANELTANIIKDASQSASKNYDDNLDNTGMGDNTNELNFSLPQTSKQNPSENTTVALDKSEYSATNGTHDENDFDHEDIQKKMNGVIQDIQSQSVNETPRKSVVSNHLHDDQTNNTTESPRRSTSESALTNHNISTEPTLPLPNRQDENSSDADEMFGIKTTPINANSTHDDSIDPYRSEQDNRKNNQLDDHDDFFNTKVASIDDDQQRPTNIIKSNNLDETTRFGTTSSSRVQSASSKRSIRLTPDEPSTSGDEKRTEMSPSKVPDDTGNDTDLDNQEVAVIARRPSRAISPLDRPRSPTPNDSLKVSTNNVPSSSSTFPPGQTQSPTDIISDDDKQQGSRPTSAIQKKSDDNSDEPTTSRASSSRTNKFITTEDQSKLIRQGEKLQIPSDDLDNGRINSPPPLPTNISSLVLANPLFGSSLVENEQDQSRPPSETNRKSPTTSMISNEKVIDGDILPSKSRRESTISQQQLNNTDQKVASRRESQTIEQTPQISSSRRTSTAQQQDELDNNKEQKVTSRRESTADEQKPASRKESNASQQQPPSRKESNASQQQPPSRKESNASQQQPASRKQSNASQQQPPSKRESVAPEPQVSSRRESTASEQKPASRKESTASEQKPASKRESVAPETQIPSRRQSTADEPQVSSRRDSFVPEQQASSRRESNAAEQKPPSRRESAALEQKTHSRKESTASEQKPASRKDSTASEQKPASRKDSTASEQKPASRKESTASEHQVQSKRGSVVPEPQISSRRESTNEEQKVASRKGSTNFEQEGSSKRQSLAPEQQVSSRRESHVSNQQIPYHRQSSSDQAEPNSSSKPVSRKSSVAEQQQQQQISSRRTSTNQDNQPTSPRRSSNVQIASSREPSRRNSITKQEQLTVPINANKDSRRSSYKEAPSSDIDDGPNRTSAKQNQKRTSSIDKRQKSSSTVDENDGRRSSFQRNSNINTDETVVTPLIMDSSKVRQQNGKRSSITDSSYDQTSLSKLPPVSSSFQQEKPRRSETSNKQQIPISNRSDIKHLSSSRATSPSEDDRSTHWTKKIPIPSIHLSDDENVSSREDQPRPQSPNVEQIAERNQAPSPPLITTSTAKKRSAQDRPKRKQQHRLSRRSTSADSVTNIQLVDDHSLDSTSDVNTDFDNHKRRHIKPKKKDVETNTDQIYDSRQQRSFFDEKELSPQRPLKATKPLSDHLHSTRRRTQNKEQILTTPDSIPDTDTTTVRRSVKQTKDSNQDKDPVHVNVTVVVKKFAGTTKDGTQHTTAEAFVEQKPQQYFETVQRPPEILPPPSTTENKEKLNESIDRPKSTDQSRIKSTEQKVIEHSDRHTQSDTEQIITDKQKKRRRPKRISRTCQTYECVFRRMERDQQQDLRTTSDTEKNIQTRKSQLRPRKKSPKKNLPVYLSPDSFHLEELLPKQFHQSRRNMSKSSAIARSLSPQGGKLLILRPTLPFHHTDAVNVHRVCLQYAIDLVPNENLSSGPMTSNRNKLSVLKQPEHTNNIPMISASSSGVNIPTQKSNTKEKSASNKTDDYTHYRKNGGAV